MEPKDSNANAVPIFDPDRGFRSWHISEIYKGPDEDGRYVPNIDDMIVDWDSGIFRVKGVDRSTGLSRYKKWELPREEDFEGVEDVLLGVDIGATGESSRLYLDDSVTPHTLAPDSRLRSYSTAAASVKYFLGTDVSDTSKVISAMYDQSGEFLGENIPLELVAMPDQNNVGVKSPVTGYTLNAIPDGEVVTAVVYGDAGEAIGFHRLLVKNTAFIRTTEANRNYVTGIRLESTFLDEQDRQLLRLPTNLPTGDVPVSGVVSYSDGSEKRLPANGGRFTLHGLDHFVSTIVGQQVPLVLTYHLGDDECCYGASPGANHHISEKYWATTTEYEEAYSIKLFAYPKWVDDIRGYTLEFYLYTLERSQGINVTQQVQIAANSPSFAPFKFGEKQRLTFVIDMDKVEGQYPPYRHTQTMEITLKKPGTDGPTNWVVANTPGQKSPYGEGLEAKVKFINTDLWQLSLGNGFNSKEEWLRHLYYATEPLYNTDTETQAPPPNIFVVKMRTRDYEFSIEQWDDDLEIINDLDEGENVVIKFIHRIYENDLQLAVAALPLHQ